MEDCFEGEGAVDDSMRVGVGKEAVEDCLSTGGITIWDLPVDESRGKEEAEVEGITVRASAPPTATADKHEKRDEIQQLTTGMAGTGRRVGKARI